MANQNKKLKLMDYDFPSNKNVKRLSKIPVDTNPHSPNDEFLQLQNDVIDVLEKRIDINSFDKKYQEKIRNYYRFSGTPYISSNPVVAKRTNNTLDII